MDANFSIKAETKTQILAVVSSEQKEKILFKKKSYKGIYWIQQ